jgi:hypothetical protein
VEVSGLEPPTSTLRTYVQPNPADAGDSSRLVTE